jgi:hypothetical protein
MFCLVLDESSIYAREATHITFENVLAIVLARGSSRCNEIAVFSHPLFALMSHDAVIKVIYTAPAPSIR